MNEGQPLAVIGAGTMGAALAFLAASRGFDVVLIDRDPAALQRAEARIGTLFEEAAQTAGNPGQQPSMPEAQPASRRSLNSSKGRRRPGLRQAQATSPYSGPARGLLMPATSLDPVGTCPFVIEAITEDREQKLDLFGELDARCSPETVLASNTSTISITLLASAARRPERVAGMHFLNPPHLMPLVEVVRGRHTSPETVDSVRRMAAALGKEAVVVGDSPGFIINRVYFPLMNEAFALVAEGVGRSADVDTAVRLGLGHPIGPLEVADLVGLDVALHALRSMYEQTGDPKFRPHPLLGRIVAAGLLGRKSGRGFYAYRESP